MNPSQKALLKVLVPIVAVVALGVGIYYASVSISRRGKAPVKVYLVPQDAALRVDGTTVTGSTIYLTPGKHATVASKAGFADRISSVDVTTTGDNIINMGLIPQSDEAKAWAKQNDKAYLDFQARGGAQAQAKSQTFQDANPIVKSLPIQEELYAIGYRRDPGDMNSIIITVDAPKGYRNGAVERIRSLGFQPSDYKYQFDNYKNPFTP